MDPLTVAAASGLRSRLDSLDLLANNLANSATSGFKSDSECYGLYTSEDGVDPSSGDPSFTLPTVKGQWTDFSQGTLVPTGSQLNVGLSGRGFLAVDGSSGPLYTRNGNLQLTTAGKLVTAEGYAVRGVDGNPIQVSPGKTIEITPDGSVRQAGLPVGQIAVVDFKNTSLLKKMGGTYFINSDSKTNPPAAATQTTVQQGKLESSNVPVAEAAMRLVGTMRQFEMLQKAIGISAEMNKKTIDEVARVGS
jgi:flagellar basal-body rod protein FlgF